MAWSRRLGSWASALSIAFGVQSAAAHSITVDGLAADWTNRLPATVDVGMIMRNNTQGGQLVWRDRKELPDLFGEPHPADLTALHISGDGNALHLFARLPYHTGANKAQLQIAIDTDRIPGSGSDSFYGGATKVSSYAAREFLVQTMFETVNKCRLLDANNVALGNVGCARGADGIEIAVPWAMLGLDGPPDTPLRLTTAVFLGTTKDGVLEANNGPASDALDAVTNYLNPGSNPGTAAELSDGVIDYYLDVWFEKDGDVMAPILIDRFDLNAAPMSSGPWLMLRNVTNYNLSTLQYKVGDEETPDGNEGMGGLGAGTINAGATLAVAGGVTNYQSTFGVLPEREMVNGSPLVQNITPYVTWGTSNVLPFSPSGDEIVLLDGSDTIIDMVVYGGGAYAGLNNTPTVQGKVFFRKQKSLDTDTLYDFAAGDPCAATSACSTCHSCNAQACTLSAAGSSCADSNKCNGAEICDAGGECLAGTPLSCADQSACTSDTCDPGLGCVNTPLAKGKPCSDGDACSDGDTCDGKGDCLGTPKACAPYAVCTTQSVSTGYASGSCSTGSCDYVQTKTECAQGCDGATGLCKNDPCQGVQCNAAPTQCHKAVGACVAGQCSYELAGEGTSCDDKDPCTFVDVCDAQGQCAGRTMACNQPPERTCDGDNSLTFSAIGACLGGGCVYDKADVVTCPLGCDEQTGHCKLDPCEGVSCGRPPSGCFEQQGICKEGTCVWAKRSDSLCDDGDPCTSADACDASGVCAGQALACEPYTVCADSMTSQSALGGACSLGMCSYELTDTFCDHGCNERTGLCQESTKPVDCAMDASDPSCAETTDAGIGAGQDAGQVAPTTDAGLVADDAGVDTGGPQPSDVDAGLVADDTGVDTGGPQPSDDGTAPADGEIEVTDQGTEATSTSCSSMQGAGSRTAPVPLCLLAGLMLTLRRRRG